MLRLALAILILASAPAVAQTYLVHPSLAACQTRSAQQCTALGCDGTLTKYWWPCLPLATATVAGGVNGTGGTTGLQILPGTPFDVSTTNKHATAGLTAPEQAAVQTETQLGTALPYIISQPTWLAHLTAPQLATINGNTGLKAQLTTIQASATVNLNSSTAQNFLSACLAAGAISQATYTVMATPQAAIANP